MSASSARALLLGGLRPLGYAELWRPQPSPGQPFQLTVTTDSSGDPMIRVHASTGAGGSATDIGFSPGDDPPYLLTPEEGKVAFGATFDDDGEVTSRWIEIRSSIPAPTDTDIYVEIGTISQDEDDNWIASNSRYGPIHITRTSCPIYFTDPMEYLITWGVG